MPQQRPDPWAEIEKIVGASSATATVDHRPDDIWGEIDHVLSASSPTYADMADHLRAKKRDEFAGTAPLGIQAPASPFEQSRTALTAPVVRPPVAVASEPLPTVAQRLTPAPVAPSPAVPTPQGPPISPLDQAIGPAATMAKVPYTPHPEDAAPGEIGEDGYRRLPNGYEFTGPDLARVGAHLSPPPPAPRLGSAKTGGMATTPAMGQVPILDSPHVGAQQILQGLTTLAATAVDTTPVTPSSEPFRRARTGALYQPPAPIDPRTKTGAADVLEGAMKLTEPVIAALAIANPIAVASALIKGGLAAETTSAVLQRAGVSPEASRLAADAAGALGAGVPLRESLDRAVWSVADRTRAMADAAETKRAAARTITPEPSDIPVTPERQRLAASGEIGQTPVTAPPPPSDVWNAIDDVVSSPPETRPPQGPTTSAPPVAVRPGVSESVGPVAPSPEPPPVVAAAPQTAPSILEIYQGYRAATKAAGEKPLPFQQWDDAGRPAPPAVPQAPATTPLDREIEQVLAQVAGPEFAPVGTEPPAAPAPVEQAPATPRIDASTVLDRINGKLQNGEKLGTKEARDADEMRRRGETMREEATQPTQPEQPREAVPEAPPAPTPSPYTSTGYDPAALTTAERRELRRMHAEMDSLPYTSRTFNDAGAGQGGSIEVTAGAGGAPVFHDIGGGTRATVTAAIQRVLDGKKPNAAGKRAIDVARGRVRNDGSMTPPALPLEAGESGVPPEAGPDDIRARANARVADPSDLDFLARRYDQRRDFGDIVSRDNAKELFYRAGTPEERTALNEAVSDAAGKVADAVYARRLAEPKGHDATVVLTSGGTGSGKTTVGAMSERAQGADVIFDSQGTDPAAMDRRIAQARASGRTVEHAYVYRDPVDAWIGGVLPRAEQTGRPVSIDGHVASHGAALRSTMAVAAAHERDPGYRLAVFDNTNGAAREVPRAEARQFLAEKAKAYNEADVRRVIRDATDSAHAAGVIPDALYEAYVDRGKHDGSRETGLGRGESRSQAPEIPSALPPSLPERRTVQSHEETVAPASSDALWREIEKLTHGGDSSSAPRQGVRDPGNADVDQVEARLREAIQQPAFQHAKRQQLFRWFGEHRAAHGKQSWFRQAQRMAVNPSVETDDIIRFIRTSGGDTGPTRVRAPLSDVLDSGEAQPRLPGDVGAVREQEQPTPKEEAPFSLTRETAERTPVQPTLTETAHTTDDQIAQALRDWNSGRAYIDGAGNYHLRSAGKDRGPIAPWNKAAKERFSSVSQLHAAAAKLDVAQSSTAAPRRSAPVTPSTRPGGGTPVTLQAAVIPGAKEFAEEDLAPIASGLFQIARDFKNLVSPQTASEGAQAAADKVREAKATAANDAAVLILKYGDDVKRFDKQSDGENIAAIAAYERTGRFPGLPQEYSDLYTSSMGLARAMLQEAYGKDQVGYIEHYVRRAFVFGSKADEEAGTAYLSRKVRSLSANRSPTKGRVLDMPLDEALADMRSRGIKVKPQTTNPETLRQWSLVNAHQAAAFADAWAQMKKGKLVTFVKMGGRVPEGLVAISERGAAAFYPKERGLGTYYADPNVARVLNNATSHGLGGFPSFEAIRVMNNSLNQLQLGLSAFHATGTAINAGLVDLSNGVRRLSRGDIGGVAPVVRSVIPLASVASDVYRGRAIINGLKSDDPVMYRFLAEVLNPAGGRVLTDTRYRNAAAANMRKAWSNGNIWGAVIRLPFAVVETVAHPLMSYAIPRVKLGVLWDRAADIRRRMPNATPAELHRAYAAAQDQIDNIFGLLVYDNGFWNRTAQDLAQVSTRSVGWTGGSLRWGLGAAGDVGRMVKQVATGRGGRSGQGRQPDVSDRVLDALLLPIYVGLIGAVYQYLHTRKRPESLQDYFMPRNGRTDPSGLPSRTQLPTYMKDVEGYYRSPVTTLVHKQSPILELSASLYRNQDYWGNLIRDQHAPESKQLFDTGTYILKDALPFTVSQVWQMRTEGATTSSNVEAFFGFTKAPRSVYQSDAEKMVWSFMTPMAKTQDQVERAALARQVRDGVRRGDATGREEAQAAVSTGKLSIRQVENAAKTAGLTSLQAGFRHLTLDQALQVWDVATPSERADIRPLLERKAESGLLAAAPADAPELARRVMAAMKMPVAGRTPVTGAR